MKWRRTTHGCARIQHVCKRFRLCTLMAAVLAVIVLLVWRLHHNKTRKISHTRRPLPDFVYEERDKESLQYIPKSVVRTWRSRDFLAVVGILSPDINVRRRRRYLQRMTCWQYKGVARKRNDFTGEMLVVFTLARHPEHNYTHSRYLKEEAVYYQDIISLPVNEGRVTTDKVIGQDGKFWGHDAEIGMSRKVYWWFELAMRLFPTTPYFSKGDDDMFLDAPQFITDLRRFTRRGLYWGDVAISRAGFYFVTGGLYTMSRDVVEQFLTFEPVRRMIDVPYTAELDANFTRYSMEHEDLLVGHVLHLRKYKDLVFIKDSQCRFHNLHGNCCTAPLTRRSMMIHNVKEWEYAWVKDKQSDESRLQPKRFWRWGKLGLITYC